MESQNELKETDTNFIIQAWDSDIDVNFSVILLDKNYIKKKTKVL